MRLIITLSKEVETQEQAIAITALVQATFDQYPEAEMNSNLAIDSEELPIT